MHARRREPPRCISPPPRATRLSIIGAARPRRGRRMRARPDGSRRRSFSRRRMAAPARFVCSEDAAPIANLHTKVVNLGEQAAAEQAAARKRDAVLVSFEPEKHRDTAAAPNAASAGGVPVAGGAGRARGTARRSRKARSPRPRSSRRSTPAGSCYSRRSAAKGPGARRGGHDQRRCSRFPVLGGRRWGIHRIAPRGPAGTCRGGDRAAGRGRRPNAASKTDSTTPLLLAAINGQFDIAMTLIQRGADPNLASAAGATPLYAVINTQWRPRSRFPQPHAVEFQKTTHLEVMEALLKAGADA